jgi:hypothetical protein
MGRWLKAIWIMGTGLLFYPFLKEFFDVFTDPVTGVMVTSGYCSPEVIAIAGFFPWGAPLVAFVISIMTIVRPEEEKIKGRPYR